MREAATHRHAVEVAARCRFEVRPGRHRGRGAAVAVVTEDAHTLPEDDARSNGAGRREARARRGARQAGGRAGGVAARGNGTGRGGAEADVAPRERASLAGSRKQGPLSGTKSLGLARLSLLSSSCAFADIVCRRRCDCALRSSARQPGYADGIAKCAARMSTLSCGGGEGQRRPRRAVSTLRWHAPGGRGAFCDGLCGGRQSHSHRRNAAQLGWRERAVCWRACAADRPYRDVRDAWVAAVEVEESVRIRFEHQAAAQLQRGVHHHRRLQALRLAKFHGIRQHGVDMAWRGTGLA